MSTPVSDSERSRAARGYALVLGSAACWAGGGLMAKWLFTTRGPLTVAWLVQPPGLVIDPVLLSTARAVEVVQFLIGHGMTPQQLSAAGFGEFDPIATNDTPEHRAQNRRIEIVLQPNLSDLPSLANLQGSAK